MALTAKMAGRTSLLAQMKGPIPQNLKQDLDAIEATLDRIIAMQRELIWGETITFYIYANEHTALNGMTWGEWVESDYNTVGAYEDDDRILTPSGPMFYPDGGSVMSIDTIQAGVAYWY